MILSNPFLFFPVPKPTSTHKFLLPIPPFDFNLPDFLTQSPRKPPEGVKIWAPSSSYIFHHKYLMFHGIKN